MTTEEYLAALKQIGLTPCGIKTSQILGLGIRQLHRLAHGYPVSKRTSQLIRVLINDGRQHIELEAENPAMSNPVSATTRAVRTRREVKV
jgi:hypothetical protein